MGGLAVKLLLVEVSVYGSLSVLCPYTHTHTHTAPCCSSDLTSLHVREMVTCRGLLCEQSLCIVCGPRALLSRSVMSDSLQPRGL